MEGHRSSKPTNAGSSPAECATTEIWRVIRASARRRVLTGWWLRPWGSRPQLSANHAGLAHLRARLFSILRSPNSLSVVVSRLKRLILSCRSGARRSREPESITTVGDYGFRAPSLRSGPTLRKGATGMTNEPSEPAPFPQSCKTGPIPAGSFNGRTACFERAHDGSSPSPASSPL